MNAHHGGCRYRVHRIVLYSSAHRAVPGHDIEHHRAAWRCVQIYTRCAPPTCHERSRYRYIRNGAFNCLPTVGPACLLITLAAPQPNLQILDALAVGAVITNAAIIGLVMTVVAEWFYPGGGVGDSVAERMEVGKLWMAVVLLEHVMLGSVVVVRRAVPAEPGWLESARLRRQLYISKVVDVSLKDLFAEIDEDGSGYLDKSEVAVLVKRLGKRFAGDDDSALTAIMAEMTFGSETRDAVQLGQFEAWWRRTMEPSEHVGPGTTPHV